jgi:6-phosphogluconolactonase (cycloisomerase 2 family)
MEVLKSLHFNLPILCVKTLSNRRLGVVDLHTTLRIIDRDTFGVVDGFKTNIKHNRYLSSYVDMTPDGEYLVSAVSDTNEAAIFSLSKRKLLYKAGRHDGEVESVGMDPSGRYFITSGQDGNSFVWVLSTSRLAFSLPPHADYVTTVTFDEEGVWIATGSYDKSINLFNTATMNEPIKLRGHSDVIKEILFLSESRLLCVERSGGVVVWDINSAKTIIRLPKMKDDVSAVCISPNKRFLFVGTKLGYVGLYDTDTMEQLSPRYLKESEEITSLAFLDDPMSLAIATAAGSLRIYSLMGDETNIMEMIQQSNFNAFYGAIEENPMLRYSKAYEIAENLWLECIEKGRLLLEKNERPKAKELFSPFSGVPNKNLIINQMLTSYEKFEQFDGYIKVGRLPLAYSLAKQYPLFQESELYQKMEFGWKKLFIKAQELILMPNGEEQAKALLAPYRGISEKTVLIQQLFEERQMYEYMKKMIAQHDYVKFFGLVHKYPFLKEFTEYAATIEYGNILYIQGQKAYAKSDYVTARKACNILISFPDYADDAHKMIETIRIKHLFYNAIASNDLPNAFTYLSTYPLLHETPEAQVLERQWNAIVDQGQKFASTGSVEETLEVFEPFMEIRDKYKAIAVVMAQAYCVQLEQKIQFKDLQEKIEYGIEHYIELFGIDEGIRSVYDYFRLLYKIDMDIEALPQGSIEQWTPLARIIDITAKL